MNRLEAIQIFKDRFNESIDKSGLTVEQIARRTGMRTRTINRHRDYSIHLFPNGYTLILFAECLDVSIDYLCGK